MHCTLGNIKTWQGGGGEPQQVMFDLELKIQTPDHSRPQAVWFFQSHVIYSIVKPHSLLLLNSGCVFYWIPQSKSSKTGFEWPCGSWSWFGNPENKTRTSIRAAGHKMTAWGRNSVVQAAMPEPSSLSPHLMPQPGDPSLSLPGALSVTLSHSCDKDSFRDEMFLGHTHC